MGHLFRSSPNGVLTKALNYKIPGKKKVGRPCYTWKTCAKQDIERSGCSLQYWKDIANDRLKFKDATKRLYQEMIESEYDEDDSFLDTDSEDDLQMTEFEGFNDEEEENFQGYDN